MWDLWLDLMLGSGCAVCGRPGRALCAACRRRLPPRALSVRPTPCPPGLVPVHAAGEYADDLKALVLAHKEHARLALARPLGELLAVSVAGLLAEVSDQHLLEVDLVPVPSHRAVVRERGHDPLLRTARVAAGRLRRLGVAAALLPALGVATRPADQAGLSAASRAENVRGRFVARSRVAAARSSAGPGSPSRPLVLVDDVMTTGATLREAQHVLDSAGLSPVGAAVVAATRRRGVLAGDAPPRLSVPSRDG